MQDKFQVAINKFIGKTLLNPQNLAFLANGTTCQPEVPIESQITTEIKETKFMKVQVWPLLEREKKKEPVFVQSKEIICPKCFEPCKYKIDNYTIKLYGCKSNHITDNIKLKDYPDSQKIDISKILCGKCNDRNKGEIHEYKFFRCLTCSINLCPICQDAHKINTPNHNIIIYEQKDYKCPQHYRDFINYCQNCKKNLCFICENEHKEHKKIYLGDLVPDTDKLKKQLEEIKATIKLFTDKINLIIGKLNELAQSMVMYYEIKNNILENYDKKNINYNILQNLEEICINDKIIENMKDINKIQNLGISVINMLDLYDKINLKYEEIKNVPKINEVPIKPKNQENKIVNPLLNNNSKIIKSEEQNNKEIKSENITKNDFLNENLNKMTIIHNIGEKDEKIKIFGDTFVNNNKNNCYIVIEGKQRELCSELVLSKNKKDNNILEIKLF